jgi:hypothetical protein
MYTIGAVNFLFDPAQTPHVKSRELCALFGVSQSACAAKTREIRRIFDIGPLDPSEPPRAESLGMDDPRQRRHCRHADHAASAPGAGVSARLNSVCAGDRLCVIDRRWWA